MAVVVGIDLLDIDSVAASIEAHGDRYLTRIYTQEERDECGMDTRKLAMRFAGKEATMKALGRTDEALAWRSIEVLTGDGGAMRVALHGPARELAAHRGIEHLALSLSAHGSRAAAMVIGEATV